MTLEELDKKITDSGLVIEPPCERFDGNAFFIRNVSLPGYLGYSCVSGLMRELDLDSVIIKRIASAKSVIEKNGAPIP